MEPGKAETQFGSPLGTSLLERVGQTPLLRLDQIARLVETGSGSNSITLLAKAEWANPGGSVKDRAAASMVQDAIDRGLLKPGKTVLDASSGNTGIAFAMLGAALGFPVHLTMPANVSPERKRILRAYGASVEWTDPDKSSDGAILRARELADNDPDYFCYMDQYSNDANWRAHYRSTGPEIWQQTAGRVTHFVAGLGTTGTFMGAARRLKEFNPAIQAISLQPDSPFHGLEGLKHLGTSMVPPIYDPSVADRELEAETEAAYDMARRLARDEGLLVGISAAAAVHASLKIAQEEAAAGRSATIVTVLPDSADKYLSERFLGGRMRSLRLPSSIYEAIRTHGEETYPHECCGALLGRFVAADSASNQGGVWVVEAAVRAGNTRTDSAHNRYQIAPIELVKIEREARGRGLDIAGFYHSHPDHPAQWSPTDFEEAHWLGCCYVITAVDKGRAAVTNSFFLAGQREEEKRFEQQTIEVTG